MRQLFIFLTCLLLPLQTLALDVKVQVQVQGLDKELETNVLAFLSIEREKEREGLTESRLRLLHADAQDEIRKALQPFGYFKPVIKGQLKQGEKGYLASYQVDAGPPILLSEVDVQVLGDGADDPKLKINFPLAPGDALDQTVYEDAKNGLQALAVEKGYLNAQYSKRLLQVDMDSYTASIRLHLETGIHYRFGEVHFKQDVMNEDFLRRYVRFQPGDDFSHEKLLTLQSNLIDSEYFSNVEVRVLREQAEDDRVPIEIQLSPNKRNRYRAGLGISTDTGPRITLDWKRRRIGGYGHNLFTELRLSVPHSFIKTEYIIPLQRPSLDSLSFGASFDHYDTDTRNGVRGLLNASHNVGLEGGWRRTLGVDFSYEDFEVGAQDDNAILLVPYAKWNHLDIDGREFIQRGNRFEFRVEAALEQLLSSTSYIQAHAKDKNIYGFGDENWRFLARAELGATLADDLLDLPASKRFFAGGDNSVRGFDLDELGPVDDHGQVVGGRFLAVGSLELERRIVGKWSAAVFIDAGNAFDPDYDSDIEYGAGFGVRWRSPVGPIRVDLASGLSADETKLRLHFVLGPDL